MKALILAAGHGTRLKHLTRTRPKPMLPIRGKPLLEHTILWLRCYGITDIAVNLHHHAHVISHYLGTGAQYGASILYSYEDELLGTAGAAKRLEAYLDEPFVVVYGDIFTNVALDRLIALHEGVVEHRQAKSALTMALYEVSNPTACGIVDTDTTGRVQRFVEKPPDDQVFTNMAAAGIMICDPGLLKYAPDSTMFDFGHDLIPIIMATSRAVYAHAIQRNEYVIDIGTLQGYLRALRISSPSTLPVAHRLST